ncbi:hypothetical protein QJS04_geneDACA021621 [Acorus gramineus]|uniref:E3 ubiquitin-protein ligase n=1 Tax=Acorus gramineus TaxID=55184 RepID=A0AAV9B632_ACOGR|nr:hypothetical protein QJS04_geneDACA021621 [Acorus gramineus]
MDSDMKSFNTPASSPDVGWTSPRRRIVHKLVCLGVPKVALEQLQHGLVAFAKKNKSMIPEIVSALFPSDEECFLVEKGTSPGLTRIPKLVDLYSDSVLWIQWLMFEGEPRTALEDLARIGAGQRGICGSVWGDKDLAYQCQTCEKDPTCAICVPCFRNGDHKDHDYFMIHTRGGCCDCGDETAWKREGFCSAHKGVEQIQPLPEEVVDSMGPVLDALLVFWSSKLSAAESLGDSTVASGLCLAVVEMLLEFCNLSDSVLSFMAKRMLPLEGVLAVLMRAERFLDSLVVKKLHEFLLKLLGEPTFKYEFGIAFVSYYPHAVLQKFPLLSTFSVQLFTVPTLTVRLVREADLLKMLLGCLSRLFISCSGEGGLLEIGKLEDIYENTFQVVDDICYVLNNAEVPKHVACDQPEIYRTWMKLLSMVQEIDPQKRMARVYVDDENENWHTPFELTQSLGNVNSLLVSGAFSVNDADESKDDSCYRVCDDGDGLRRAIAGRFSPQNYTCNVAGKIKESVGELQCDANVYLSVPSAASLLFFECLKAIENCFGMDTKNGKGTSSGGKTSRCGIRGKMGSLCWPFSEETFERPGCSSYVARGPQMNGNLHGEKAIPSGVDGMDVSRTYPEQSFAVVPDGTSMQMDSHMDLDSLGLFSLTDWPNVIYDVSSREISYHIPLHRLLSLLLRKVVEKYHGKSGMLGLKTAIPVIPSSGFHPNFFQQILRGTHPFGFSSFVMEHPLRLRVVVAQVRAGMWRRNGDAAIACCEGYCFRWCEQGLESDLFLLQCCAALAPPEFYVKRIQERFGLSNYLSLNLKEYDECEPVLIQEMLTLLIQIVKERRFCGLSTTENLQRELVYKLAVGDATRSQLTKSLPQDLSKSNELQNVLDTVAEYSKPSGIKQGRYTLRKSYWKELDLYHPRWSSRELQIAEERYLQLFKVSPQTSQLPLWTRVFQALSPIYRIAMSKAVFMIIRAVVFYATFTEKTSVSRAPEGVLLTALHLLSLALDICEKQNTHMGELGGNADFSYSDNQSCGRTSVHDKYYCPLLLYASKEIDSGSTNQSDTGKHESMLSLLVLLLGRYKKENDLDNMDSRQSSVSSLIESLLRKFAELDVHCKSSLSKLVPDIIAHLPQQPSHHTMPGSVVASNAEKRKAKKREHQAAILEKMRAEQSKFLASLKSSMASGMDSLNYENDESISCVDQILVESTPIVCSLCHDPDPTIPISFMVLLQKSCLTSLVEKAVPSWEDFCQSNKDFVRKNEITHDSTDESGIPEVNSVSQSTSNELLYESLLEGTNSTSSVEMIEKAIYKSVQEYIHDSSNEVSTMTFSVPHAEDSYRKSNDEVCLFLEEYFGLENECPNNPEASISDAVFKNKLLRCKSSEAPSASVDRYCLKDCDGIHISTCGHVVHQECHNSYLKTMRQGYNMRHGEGGRSVDPDQGEFLCPVCRRFGNSILPSLPGDIDMRKRIMSSDVSSTSLAGCSTSSESENYVCLLSQALTLLQKTANMVGQNGNAMRLDRQRGIMPDLVKINNKGDVVPHLQFYKQAADPILAHDPFSSLMWVLFCLPHPFLSSIKSFISLVHLFYAVCVAQALITYHGKRPFGTSELGLGDCGLNDICRTTGESELAKQFFLSNYIDISCHPKDMIRRLTFPYLRRCALLWKLLTSSMSAPFYNNDQVREKVCHHTNNDALDSSIEISIELEGIRELEHMFQITLDLVLKNEVVHTLSLKWCQHFLLVHGDRNYGHSFHCTPAVPFKLLHLPYIYQDLLQRENGCQNHVTVCGAGIGVFLIIRRTTILLQRHLRQATWPSPYLDAFGEEDFSMLRGKPLYLNEERYAALTHLVASHGLDSNSQIFYRSTIPIFNFDA